MPSQTRHNHHWAECEKISFGSYNSLHPLASMGVFSPNSARNPSILVLSQIKLILSLDHQGSFLRDLFVSLTYHDISCFPPSIYFSEIADVGGGVKGNKHFPSAKPMLLRYILNVENSKWLHQLKWPLSLSMLTKGNKYTDFLGI